LAWVAQNSTVRAGHTYSVDLEIEGTFSFGVFGNIAPFTRNAYHNNVGGYMKGRNVIVGEKSRTK